ncbi:MAG: methylmalonyl-CoA epimerase [Deltaproteobacteria bacterium]
MKIHHIGIAVDSLEAAVPVFAKILGCQPKSQEIVEDQRVRVAVFELENSRIELLEATTPDSPVGRFVTKRGRGIHHLTVTVPDLRAALEQLSGAGVQPLDREPRTGADRKQIAFLDPKTTSGILIELVEEK